MRKRIHQIITSLKEHTFVSYAKIAALGGLSDINIIVLKATSPDDFPLPEKYVHELLKIFSISPSSCRAFVITFSGRFGKTQAWRVALKCLLLLHRLLRALPNLDFFRAELLWARSNGMLSLYPCNFRDSSSSASKGYTTFVRSYARLLDEVLDCSSTSITIDEQIPSCLIKEDHSQEIVEENVQLKLLELGRMIEVLPQLQSLIDRVIDCRPASAVARSYLVQLAMKHITRDSFSCYNTFRREIVVVLENLIQLPYRNSVAAFGIYKKAAYQADHLSDFLEWSKTMGYCGLYEYPFVDRVPKIQIRALEAFLNGMWQLSDNESSNTSSLGMQSPVSMTLSTLTDEGEGFGRRGMEEMGPLIQWEDAGWEDLLEASVSGNCSRNWQLETHLDQVCHGGQSLNCDFQMKNPFCQQQSRMVLCHGSCPSTPTQPWDIS